MKKAGIGGGNTKTGINFEGKQDFINLLDKLPHYSIRKTKIGNEIYYKEKIVANSFKKYDFYRYLETRGVKWKNIITKRLLPDDAIYVIHNNTLYILEIKYQDVLDYIISLGCQYYFEYLPLQKIGLPVPKNQ